MWFSSICDVMLTFFIGTFNKSRALQKIRYRVFLLQYVFFIRNDLNLRMAVHRPWIAFDLINFNNIVIRSIAVLCKIIFFVDNHYLSITFDYLIDYGLF